MDQHLHLGVTGLRRSGKTVFLTALIYQLSELGSNNLGRFRASGVKLGAGHVHPPRHEPLKPFDYTRFLESLRAEEPSFPPATAGESGCRLRLYYQTAKENNGNRLLSRLAPWTKQHGAIHLHLHDYPGEYLLDVGLAQQSYDQWSAQTLARMQKQRPNEAAAYVAAAEDLRQQPLEPIAVALRDAYGRYVRAAQAVGLEFIQPSMTLLNWYERCRQPGEADTPDSTELPFFPLPPALAGHAPLWQEMRQQYEQHVKGTVRPFLKRLRKCRTQLVLVDVLRVLRHGAQAYNDTRQCLSEILNAYHDRRGLFGGGVQRVLFAATKADHATRSHRANLSRLLDKLVEKARGAVPESRVQIPSSEFFTSVRATHDETMGFDGRPVEVLVGNRKGDLTGKVTHNPGVVPAEWPVDEAEVHPWDFGNPQFDFPEFGAKRWPLLDGAPVPHINLDQVIWKILEDCFLSVPAQPQE